MVPVKEPIVMLGIYSKKITLYMKTFTLQYT